MSQVDIQRFVSDLKGNQALLDEVKSGAVGLGAVVELAQSKGYDITVEEAKAYIRDQANQELSDEQLDAVAGGKSHHHRSHKQLSTSVAANATSNVAAVTNEAAVAETTVNVVAEVCVVLT